MGALLRLPVTKSGQCLVSPVCVGLVTETSVALLLLEQPDVEHRDKCSCHAADLRATHVQSRILITDCDGNQHVFAVLTSVLHRMLGIDWLYEVTDGVSCTQLQGTILKPTPKGNAWAAQLRQLGRY